VSTRAGVDIAISDILARHQQSSGPYSVQVWDGDMWCYVGGYVGVTREDALVGCAEAERRGDRARVVKQIAG